MTSANRRALKVLAVAWAASTDLAICVGCDDVCVGVWGRWHRRQLHAAVCWGAWKYFHVDDRVAFRGSCVCLSAAWGVLLAPA